MTSEEVLKTLYDVYLYIKTRGDDWVKLQNSKLRNKNLKLPTVAEAYEAYTTFKDKLNELT